MPSDQATDHVERLRPHQLEIGVTDALQKHIDRQVIPTRPVSQRKLDFEHKRPRLLRECMAEATGVFFYVFPGCGALATFILAGYEDSGKELGVSTFGGILQIGLAFAFGITFAIITCGATSGGHFNPAITIALSIFQGFPLRKVPYYIFSQIFGAFLAGLVIMGCYWPEIQAAKAANLEEHGTAVFNGGVASIFCTFPTTTQTNQGYLFFQEFMVDSFIGLVIWTCLDPANPFVSPVSVPWTIGLAYGTMVIGFAANSISTNLARDLGPRIVAAIFFGKEAFTYSNSYAWISILVNIPATLFAAGYYEFLMRDSLQKIHTGQAEHEDGEDGLVRHLTKIESADTETIKITKAHKKDDSDDTMV